MASEVRSGSTVTDLAAKLTMSISKTEAEYKSTLTPDQDSVLPTGVKIIGERTIQLTLEDLRNSKVDIQLTPPAEWSFFNPAIVWALPPQNQLQPIFGTGQIVPGEGGRECTLSVTVAPETKDFQYTFFFVLVKGVEDADRTVMIVDPTIVSDPPPGRIK
jgi:hypothetical protein